MSCSFNFLARPGSVAPVFPIPPALYWLREEPALCMCCARCDCVTEWRKVTQPNYLLPLFNSPSQSIVCVSLYSSAFCVFGGKSVSESL